MHVFRFSRIVSIVLFMIVLINNVLFLISISQPQIIGKATEHHPHYFVEYPEYLAPITDFAICDDFLYVLFESKGVLTCFDLDGRYSHSYAFRMGKNGEANLYVKGNNLYLESRIHTFYTFQDGKFIDFFKPDISQISSIRKSLTESKDARLSKNGEEYQLIGASIWKKSNEISETILKRSKWMVIFQGNTQIYIYFICFLLLFLNHWIRTRFRP